MKHDEKDERFPADIALKDANPDEFDAVLLFPKSSSSASNSRVATWAARLGLYEAASAHKRTSETQLGRTRISGTRTSVRPDEYTRVTTVRYPKALPVKLTSQYGCIVRSTLQ